MPASVPRELDPVAGMSMDALIEPVAADLELCRQNLLRMLGHRHPMLMAAANQIFSGGGKQLRPLVVLLVAKATLPLMNLRQVQGGLRGARFVCLPVGGGGSIHGLQSGRWRVCPSGCPRYRQSASCIPHPRRQLSESHRRLAEIAEMIHTASLVHDDVLDGSPLRRGEVVMRFYPVADVDYRKGNVCDAAEWADKSWMSRNIASQPTTSDNTLLEP